MIQLRHFQVNGASNHYWAFLKSHLLIENTKANMPITYDFSNQLPIYLADKGVVPEKNVRELAKQVLLNLVDNIGITKVK